MAFYLKYRPQTIDELDLSSVRDALTNALSKDPVPHAFLFAGPKGTGKTSAARIVAKVLNCEKLDKKTLTPCNSCSSCLSITKGTHVDIVEMDAASNRGIDDIRTLKEAVKLAPASANYKVYIIDEAHMLTTEASNALLKTLEEPPLHVVFILATTNPEKLISTIRSRTTLIPFKKATNKEIVASLSKKIKGEKLEVEDGALEMIAEVSDGAFRDADKILEQIAKSSSKITINAAKEVVGGSFEFDPQKMFLWLEKNDTKSALEFVQKAVDGGASTALMIDRLIDLSRDILLARYDIKTKTTFETKLSKTKIMEFVSLLIEAKEDIAYAYLPHIPLELVIMKITSKKEESPPEAQEVSVDSSKNDVSMETKNESDHSKTSTVVTQTNETKDVKIVEENSVTEVQKEEKIRVDTVSQKAVGDTLDAEIWKQILSTVRTTNASTEALLRAAHPLDYDGEVLKLGVYYTFHKEHLESQVHRALLEDTCKEILGNQVAVECFLTNAPEKPPETIAVQQVPSVEPQTDQGETGGSNSALTDADNEDIIKIAEEIFGE